MALLSWSDEYLIGNLTIDTEHKELFRLINSFHDHWREKQDRKDIAQVLNQLVSYAQIHFQHEEEIMTRAEYPKLEDHQNIHEALFDTIFNLHQALAEKDLRLEMDTMKFVKDWLVGHIVQNDYLFRDYLARRKKQEAAAQPAEIDAAEVEQSTTASLEKEAPEA